MQNLSDKEIVENEVAFLSKKILELNKKLIDSQKAKTLFLSLVANKLNDPMTAILGMLPHLKIQDGDENEKIFSLIQEEALNLDFKIQNIITVAEIESGKLDTTHILIDIKEIVNETIKNLRYVIKEKNIQINIENSIEHKIVLDPKKTYTIMKNLISNGCINSPQNGVVDIILTLNSDILTIAVKNRSDGINVNHKLEVFTRFVEKLDGKHGLGIGLSIVRDLCESLGGAVDYNVSDGFVTFEAKLPLTQTNEFLFDSFDDAFEL